MLSISSTRPSDLHLDAAQITESLRLQPDEIQGVANDLAVGILGWFGSLLSVVIDLVTVVVFAFYIAAAGPKLVQQLAVWLPPDRQLVLVDVWDIAEQKTGGYVASKVVLAAISAFFHGVFFWAIGLPGWLPLGLLAGITAQFIPVIGTYIGVAVPVLVALAEKPLIAVWIVLFAIVYQQIETYILTPADLPAHHGGQPGHRLGGGLRRRRDLGADRRHHRGTHRRGRGVDRRDLRPALPADPAPQLG